MFLWQNRKKGAPFSGKICKHGYLFLEKLHPEHEYGSRGAGITSPINPNLRHPPRWATFSKWDKLYGFLFIGGHWYTRHVNKNKVGSQIPYKGYYVDACLKTLLLLCQRGIALSNFQRNMNDHKYLSFFWWPLHQFAAFIEAENMSKVCSSFQTSHTL